jgi:uncharacterized protein (DUF849 family)
MRLTRSFVLGENGAASLSCIIIEAGIVNTNFSRFYLIRKLLTRKRTRALLIKACLNGSRERGEHRALPLSAEELARDAEVAVAAGAGALHIHPRNIDGKQSLDAQDQAAAIAAIRARCPGIPIGVSTGIWIEPNPALRLRKVQKWTVLPDFASVNFDEPGVADLCHALLQRGIGVEAGISSIAEARLLSELDLADRCLRILIEPGEDETETALINTSAIIRVLDEQHIQLPRLLHGFAAAAWPILHAALDLGYDTRIGLEDTLTLPDGRTAQGNTQLVSLAVSKSKSMHRANKL